VSETTVLDRLADKFTVDDGCWLWIAGTDRNGYGKFYLDGRMQEAHRVVYELLIGPIPDGLQLDHVKDRGCTSHACVRPDHLEPVTQRINLLRGDTIVAREAASLRCPQNHEYDYIDPRGNRGCMECRRVARRKSRQKLGR
jgi:hypothetical protein